MKRTRSPSPEGFSNSRRVRQDVKRSEAHNGESGKNIKALEGIELHPLLSGESNKSGTAALVVPKVERENPFLAHWDLSNDTKKKKKERIPHFDRNLVSEPSSHRPRPLKFNRPGKFVAKAEAERTAQQIKQLEREIAEATEDLGEILDVSIVADMLRSEERERATLVEWWDVPFIQGEISSKNINFDLIGNLIQRPSLKCLPNTQKSTGELKIYLTNEERKKLRRQRRLEQQKELAEKIALGLLPPPPPKVKLSSLPRMLAQPGNALGDESVQEPTKVAAEIRAQSVARLQAHQQSNAERKLNEDERAAKNFRKYAELDATETHVAVFKLFDRLEDGAKRFKIIVNAEQNHLHGRVLTTPDFSLIIVEGGPKGIKRYTNLILNRLNGNVCNQLIWSGIQPQKSEKLTNPEAGKPFQIKIVEKTFEAQEYLEKWGYAHFWSLAQQK